MIYLQFKIINRILGTKSLLYKISLTDNPLCTFCKEQEETIPHLFYDCNEVLLLWQTLYQWISSKLNTHLRPEKNSILLGYIEPYINIPLNTINMVTKSYIFHCSKKNRRLNIYHLQNRLKTTYQTIEFIATKNDQQDKLKKTWILFKNLFNE